MEQLDLYELMEEDQHDPEIQYKLGLCYLHGYGTQKDPAQAEIWLKRAAEQGHSEAAALLGEATREEIGDAITPETLPQWCLRAEDGDMDAQYRVACYYLQLDEKAHSREIDHYLKEAADQGHGQACLVLGRQLLGNQPEEAALYLNRACECNLSQAAELLSSCYYCGMGVEKDPEKAEQLLLRASQWGDAEANFRIALRYALGKQIPANQVKAMAFLAKAQQFGMENARQRFDAQVESFRQAEQARLERQRRLEEERIRAEQEAQRRRVLEQEEAARKAAQAQAAKEQWIKEHYAPLKAAVAENRKLLSLVKLRNAAAYAPWCGVGCGILAFWLAKCMQTPQIQAVLLGVGFGLVGVVLGLLVKKKIKPLDPRALQQQLDQAENQLTQWEKEGRV